MNNLEIYTPYMDDCKALELLEHSYDFDFSKGQRGGTSMCLLIEDYAVLYSNTFIANPITPEEFKKTMNLVYTLFSQSVKVAPILGYIRSRDNQGIYNPFVHKKNNFRDLVILKRAPGLALNNMSGYKQMVDKIHERLASSENHYDEIVNTFVKIISSGIRPDISRNNIMFESTSGFTFVDFNGLEKTRNLNLESEYFLYQKYHVARFLKSFITDKKFLNDQMKQEYFDTAVREQQVLCDRLLNTGIPEETLEQAIKENVYLKMPTLDKLYSK